METDSMENVNPVEVTHPTLTFVYDHPTLDVELERPVRWMSCAYDGCQALGCFTAPYCEQHCEQVYGLSIRRSTIRFAGLGLFTSRDIHAGQWICPTWGETITCDEATSRYGKDLSKAPFIIAHPRTATAVVDGASEPFIGNFANTQLDLAGVSRAELNNARICERKLGSRNPTWPLWIQATQFIAAGQEIFSYYGGYYTNGKIYDYMYQDQGQYREKPVPVIQLYPPHQQPPVQMHPGFHL